MELLPLARKIRRKFQRPKYHPPKKSGDKFNILGRWMYIDDKAVPFVVVYIFIDRISTFVRNNGLS